VAVFHTAGWRLRSAEGVRRVRITFVFRTSRGLLVSQQAEASAQPAQGQTQFRLPVHGRWLIVWGQDADSPLRRAVVFGPGRPRIPTRYGVVLARADADGRIARGAGVFNEEYFSWGQDVVAAAAGRVVRVANHIPDHIPGVVDGFAPAGNHVILDHGNGEYSFYLHLQSGSVRVRAGDSVEAGAVIGRVGNSGSTPYPRLVFFVADSPSWAEADGRPFRFAGVTSAGQPVEGLVRSGWIVEPAGAP
jgi:hypothetical protein